MIGADRYWESTLGANMQPVQCFNTFQLWEAGMSILFVLAACVTSGAPVCLSGNATASGRGGESICGPCESKMPRI